MSSMQVTGEFKGVAVNWTTNRYILSFEIDEDVTHEMIDGIKDSKLSIKVEKFRKKRSLDSNAYAWVLMQKIAEAIESDKWSVYLDMLQQYSRAFTHVIVKPNAVERMKELYRTCIDLGEVSVNGVTGNQLQVYYGSSTFNTKEMSVFLEGIVWECKKLGIETLTPDEIARMNAVWGVSNG